MHKAIDDAQVGKVSDQAQKTMELVQQVSADLSRVLAQPGLAELTSQTQALVVSTRRQIEANGEELQGLSKSLGQTAASAQRIAERLDGYMGSDKARDDMTELRAAIASMRKAADDIPGSLDRTLGKADRLLESQQRNMEQILDNFRQISENLRSLSERAKDYPSQVIFGGPPPPAQAGGRP
jgi:methyl-accepting chemotaxis protein